MLSHALLPSPRCHSLAIAALLRSRHDECDAAWELLGQMRQLAGREATPRLLLFMFEVGGGRVVDGGMDWLWSEGGCEGEES